jgi:hypothetical protein
MGDSFCNACGARFANVDHYPRSCEACGVQVWANPIPVAVTLVPVSFGARTGLLVVRDRQARARRRRRRGARVLAGVRRASYRFIGGSSFTAGCHRCAA